MKKLLSVVSICVFVSSIFAAVPNTSVLAADVQFIKIVTGNPAGRWYPFGARLSQLINQHLKGVNASVSAGGGVSNVRAVHQNEAQLGITYGVTAVNGFTGVAPFGVPQENIRGLGIIEMAWFNPVVRKDSKIYSFADLKNRRVAAGNPGFFSAQTLENILNAYELSFESIRAGGGTISNVSWSDAAEMMKDGNVDFIGVLTGIPFHTIMSLTTTCPIRLLSIDDEHFKRIIEKEPGYVKAIIPARTYVGVDTDTITLGATTEFVVNKDLPDDLVYEITRLFYEEVPRFKEGFEQFNEINYKLGYADIGIPMHPGAKRYFDEKLKN